MAAETTTTTTTTTLLLLYKLSPPLLKIVTMKSYNACTFQVSVDLVGSTMVDIDKSRWLHASKARQHAQTTYQSNNEISIINKIEAPYDAEGRRLLTTTGHRPPAQWPAGQRPDSRSEHRSSSSRSSSGRFKKKQ
jgi:hypothetical protein